MNGLGVDDWLTSLLAEAKLSASALVQLGPNEPGVAYLTGTDGTGSVNPHLWMNVAYADLYVKRIVAALQAAAPAKQAALQASVDAYLARLAALDSTIRAQIATIPPANRKLVSYHDAFPYFAAAYGLTIIGSVVPAPCQDPSAGQVAALIAAIRASGVKAIFSGPVQPEGRAAAGRGGGRDGGQQPVRRRARTGAGRHVRGDDAVGRRPGRRGPPVIERTRDLHAADGHVDDTHAVDTQAAHHPGHDAGLHAARHPAIVLSDVTVDYDGRAALTDVSVTVAAGTILAVFGPNGGGKSTFLKVVAGSSSHGAAASRCSAPSPAGRPDGSPTSHRPSRWTGSSASRSGMSS
jgi:ABC-type multidrug transport system fused ATPase/permease subunit